MSIGTEGECVKRKSPLGLGGEKRGSRNFQQVTGLGGQGGELGILRQWDLRGWGGKMRPGACHGRMALSSVPLSARPRLPGAHHPGRRAHVTAVGEWVKQLCYPYLLVGQKAPYAGPGH